MLTVMAIISGTEASPRLSVTDKAKDNTVGSEGAVKVGVTASGLLNATIGPAVCTHR